MVTYDLSGLSFWEIMMWSPEFPFCWKWWKQRDQPLDINKHTGTHLDTHAQPHQHMYTRIYAHTEEKLGISFEDIGTLGIFLDTKPGQGGHEGVPEVSMIWGRNWHPSTLLQQLGATLKVPSSDVLSHSCVSTESLGMNHSLCVYRAAPG